MTDNPLIANLLERIRNLRREAAAIEGLLPAQQISLRLDRALTRWESSGGLARPTHIALLGGTGVGKSNLFNAMVGKPEASPTSDTLRVFTKVPHVAVHPSERALAQVPLDPPPVFLDVGVAGVVLCDTPDVDGMLRENWDTTRHLLEQADLVVYVTEPDRRASFRITEELRTWAHQKRWFFVLNKADQYEAELDKVTADFDKRLRDLGFSSASATRFVVSARQMDRFDGPRLRNTLFHPRPEEQRALLRLDALAGYTQHAVDPALLRAVESKGQVLAARELELRGKVHAAYVESLKTPEAASAFRVVVRETAWRQLGSVCGPFMWLPIWLRCRFSMFWATYQVSRLTMRGLSIFGLVGIGLSSLFAALRGFMPLRQIVAALGPIYRQRMTEVRNDALRILEDEGLARLAAPEKEEDDAKKDEITALAAKAPAGLGSVVEKVLRGITLKGVDEEVLAQLENDVERLGAFAAQRTRGGLFGFIVRWLANLIPAAMLGWILYRLGEAWLFNNPPPLSFYALALPLQLVSFIPGFILLSLRLRGRVGAIEAATLVRQVDQPRATEPLRQVSEKLSSLVVSAKRLGDQVAETRETLTLEGGLDPAVFGVAPRTERNGPP
jgi:GTPase SAR1 family protein